MSGNPVYVQYGCGFAAPPEWRNFDASPTLRFERIPVVGKLYTKNSSRFPSNVDVGDIVKGLPVPDGVVDAVYCSHVLEHLALADFRLALRNTSRILKPSGVFRLVMPDLEFCIQEYVVQKGTPGAAMKFMERTGLGFEERPRGIRGLMRAMLGNSQHLWLWDYESVARELAEAGFKGIRRAKHGDALDPMFKQVELADRWTNCLGVESFKPPALSPANQMLTGH